MTIFSTLLAKILPLYFLIFLGFLVGRRLQIQKEAVARLLIYIFSPAVVFHAVVTTELSPSVLSLPVVFYILCGVVCVLFLALAKRLWRDSSANILAFAAADGNTGYFGLPVALALFGEQSLGLMVLMSLGFVLYENTIGFFVVARGRHTLQESLRRLVRLPAIYAFGAGVIVNLSQAPLGVMYFDLADSFKKVYLVLGMMLIGCGLSAVTKLKIDYKFIGISFAAKFVLWPAVVLGIIALDRAWLHWYTPFIHSVMFLIAIVPLAANTVAYATEFDTEPAKASTAVFLSTLFALPYIPLMVTFFSPAV